MREVPPIELWYGSKRQKRQSRADGEMPDGGGDPSEDHVEHVDPDMQAIPDLIGPSGGAGEVLDEAPPEAPDEAEDEAEGATEDEWEAEDEAEDGDDASGAEAEGEATVEALERPEQQAAPRPEPRAEWDKIYCADQLGYLRLSYSSDAWQIRGACLQPEHGPCSWTRTCTAWRPVGAAWAYSSFRCATKAQHHAFRDMMMRDQTVRRRARQELRRFDQDAFDTFASTERDFVSLGPLHEDEVIS